MSPRELIAYVLDGKADFAQRSASLWMTENPAFLTLIENYRDKTRAKVRRCGTEHALRDLLWELEIAHLLLKNRDFEIEYEPYGTGGSRSPDYRVSVVSGGSFNLEATRIREGSSETRFQIWEKEIKDAIRAVPSQVGVTLTVGNLVSDSELLDRLDSHRDVIKALIIERVAQADDQLLLGKSRRYSIRIVHHTTVPNCLSGSRSRSLRSSATSFAENSANSEMAWRMCSPSARAAPPMKRLIVRMLFAS